MKKLISLIFLWVFSFFGAFILNASAAVVAPVLNTGNATKTTSYIDGITVYVKTTADNKPVLYCENEGLLFPANKTIKLKGEANQGYIYMLQNKPKFADANKNYFIMQTAVWWYDDILSKSNGNLSAAQKNKITSGNDEVSKKIYSLVQNAKSFVIPTGNLIFDLSPVTFTEKNGYYISSEIKVISMNLTSLTNIVLSKAPSKATIINEKIGGDLNGKFQVRIPVSSVKDGKTVTFEVKTTGTYDDSRVYDYYYSAGYQNVLYDKVYTTEKTVNASRTIKITGEEPEEDNNSLTIYKYDENNKYIYDAELTLYEGNCVNTKCLNKNEYASFVTNTGYKVLNDLPVGYYTLVETKTPTGYQTAEKQLIHIKSANKDYIATVINIKIIDNPTYYRISKTDITGQKEIAGASLILKNEAGKVQASWISSTTPKYLELKDGIYSLTETIAPTGYKLSTTIIKFKIQNKNIYEQNENGSYTKVNHIKMVNILEDENDFLVNINKLNNITNEYVIGAKLSIQNIKGENIASWTTTNDTYYLSLNPGKYILSEISAPDGYKLNSDKIYFTVTENGKITIKNSSGNYEEANGIIFYNIPEDEIVEVPKTDFSNTLTYIIGAGVLTSGVLLLRKNGKLI